MSTMLKDILASIVSAVFIAIIFTSWSDSEFKEYNLTGKWKLETTTSTANVPEYIGMKLYYYVHIIQSNDKVTFSAEKVKENSINGGTIKYTGKNRTYLKCQGTKKYNYFSKNKLVLNCNETGRVRETTMILDLDINLKDKMTGTFLSSAANSDGTIEITRNNDNKS